MSETKIRIRAFGIMRNVADEAGWITLDLGAVRLETLKDLKAALKDQLRGRNPNFNAEIIDHCVVATENEILDEGARLTGLQGLALLPPVSGG